MLIFYSSQHLFILKKNKKVVLKIIILYQSNENMYDIAQEEGVQLESLLAYNNFQKNNQPKPGDKILLYRKIKTVLIAFSLHYQNPVCMQEIRIHDKVFIPYLSQTEIEAAIKKLAEKSSEDYADKCPLFIAILNGSFMFAAELFKHISIPSEISFIKLASYKGTTSSGHIITSIGLDTDIKGKHIIILEDIIDTGKTLSQFLPQIIQSTTGFFKNCCIIT